MESDLFAGLIERCNDLERHMADIHSTLVLASSIRCAIPDVKYMGNMEDILSIHDDVENIINSLDLRITEAQLSISRIASMVPNVISTHSTKPIDTKTTIECEWDTYEVEDIDNLFENAIKSVKKLSKETHKTIKKFKTPEKAIREYKNFCSTVNGPILVASKILEGFIEQRDSIDQQLLEDSKYDETDRERERKRIKLEKESIIANQGDDNT